MHKRQRNYTAKFKSNVVLTAIPGYMTIAELALKLDMHFKRIQQWKKLFCYKVNEI